MYLLPQAYNPTRVRLWLWTCGLIALAAATSAEEVSIKFTPRRAMSAPPIPRSEDGYQSLEGLDVWSVGRIENGRHAGSTLALARVKYSFEAKGPGVLHFYERRLRFAVTGRQWTLLERMSNLKEYDTDGISDVAETCFTLTRAGMKLERDQTTRYAALDMPESLTPCGSAGLLVLEWEMDGEPDHVELAPLCALEGGATLYVSRARNLGRDVEARDAGDCVGAQCFGTNGFFVFRPDGTYLMYAYEIEMDLSAIAWKNQSQETPVGQDWPDFVAPFQPLKITASPTGYLSRSWRGCDGTSFSDFVAVLPPESVRRSDLVEVGHALPGGGPIYTLRSAGHPVMKLEYEIYRAWVSEYRTQEARFHPERINSVSRYRIASAERFLNSRALLLWQDPFGRWIKLVRREFIPPAMCEPMIYLYPPKAIDVQIKLGGKVRLTDSFPRYREGWTVHASPDGMLLDRESGRPCTRIFWEGSSLLLPEPESGFVWNRAEVPGRLAEVLAVLGLNDRERREFLGDWLERLTASPWVQVSFREPWEIELMAPLSVEPVPQTMIRVLMDWRPLEQHVLMPEPSLRRPPVREGFVLVEWGGLVR